jgi:hypothetical protein
MAARRFDMVTVKNIGLKAGYTGADHLLDATPLQDMIGRTYRDAKGAKRAANNIQQEGDCGSTGVPIWIELDVCGDEVHVTA